MNRQKARRKKSVIQRDWLLYGNPLVLAVRVALSRYKITMVFA